MGSDGDTEARRTEAKELKRQPSGARQVAIAAKETKETKRPKDEEVKRLRRQEAKRRRAGAQRRQREEEPRGKLAAGSLQMAQVTGCGTCGG